MRLIEINTAPARRQLRTFGVIWFPLFCGMVGLIVWKATRSDGAWIAASSVAVLSVLLGLVAPKLLRPLFVGLMVVSFPIGWVVSHVLMAFVYYAVITPVGLALRIAGRDLLNRRLEPDAKTYWEAMPAPENKGRYFKGY
jgi:hypothetical protein